MTVLAEALRLIRIFHDMKQNELAAHLGISGSHLSEIESGKKQPTLKLVEHYSSEFEIPVSSILFFSEKLENPSGSSVSASRARGVIARKVITFLQLVESRSATVDEA